MNSLQDIHQHKIRNTEYRNILILLKLPSKWCNMEQSTKVNLANLAVIFCFVLSATSLPSIVFSCTLSTYVLCFGSHNFICHNYSFHDYIWNPIHCHQTTAQSHTTDLCGDLHVKALLPFHISLIEKFVYCNLCNIL